MGAMEILSKREKVPGWGAVGGLRGCWARREHNWGEGGGGGVGGGFGGGGGGGIGRGGGGGGVGGGGGWGWWGNGGEGASHQIEMTEK